MKPHKWHKEIKAWADGAEIEMWVQNSRAWLIVSEPHWGGYDYEFRIKPQPKEPQYLYVWLAKDTGEAVLEFEPPQRITNDDLHKYIGKIKLEDAE